MAKINQKVRDDILIQTINKPVIVNSFLCEHYSTKAEPCYVLQLKNVQYKKYNFRVSAVIAFDKMTFYIEVHNNKEYTQVNQLNIAFFNNMFFPLDNTNMVNANKKQIFNLHHLFYGV